MSASSPSPEPTLYLLDFGTSHDPYNPLHKGRLIRASPTGNPASFHPILDDLYLPDSIDVDEGGERLYFTCMGIPGAQDGSVHSCNYDGSDLRDVLSKGVLNTPKQIVVDSKDGWIYLCDREGLRIVRCRLDGQKQVEDLIVAGKKEILEERADQMRWCVGIAIDRERGMLYWTMKGMSVRSSLMAIINHQHHVTDNDASVVNESRLRPPQVLTEATKAASSAPSSQSQMGLPQKRDKMRNASCITCPNRLHSLSTIKQSISTGQIVEIRLGGIVSIASAWINSTRKKAVFRYRCKEQSSRPRHGRSWLEVCMKPWV